MSDDHGFDGGDDLVDLDDIDEVDAGLDGDQDGSDGEIVVAELVEDDVTVIEVDTEYGTAIVVDEVVEHDVVTAEVIDGEVVLTETVERTEDVMVLETWQIELPATGDSQVDAAVARLAEVAALPPAEHADVYEAVHAGLQDALADLDRA